MADGRFKERSRSLAFRIWRRINRNLGLRLLSLAIAFGLWVFVNAGQRTVIDELPVPINYQHLPAGYVIVNRPPEMVKLQVTGPRTLLSLLDPDRLTVKLDLSGISIGQASFKITPSYFNPPRGTVISSVSPSDISVDVDKVVQRALPVHLDVQGTPAPGYQIGSSSVDPTTVIAIGPSRFVNEIHQVNTETLDITGATSDIDHQLDLEAPNPSVALTSMRVEAKAEIVEKISNREFRGLDVQVHNSDYKFRMDPAKVNVTIRGPILQLQSLDPKGIVYVDANQLEPGFHELPLQVNLPGGMQVVREFPDKVRLRVYREKRSNLADEHPS